MNQNINQQEQESKVEVEVDSPWFKIKLADVDWKVITIVGMILASIVYIIKG